MGTRNKGTPCETGVRWPHYFKPGNEVRMDERQDNGMREDVDIASKPGPGKAICD